MSSHIAIAVQLFIKPHCFSSMYVLAFKDYALTMLTTVTIYHAFGCMQRCILHYVHYTPHSHNKTDRKKIVTITSMLTLALTAILRVSSSSISALSSAGSTIDCSALTAPAETVLRSCTAAN
eukprot:6803-Heterococcus_DN1.PRE.3